MPRFSVSWGVVLLLAATSSAAPGPSAWAGDQAARPPPIAQCRAWFEHVTDLVDQHRITQEVDDDTFDMALRQFMSARDACTMGDYATGLRLYEVFPLARAKGLLK